MPGCMSSLPATAPTTPSPHSMRTPAAGRGAYRTLFISSNADPRRDADWYRANVEEAADPESARREHARCPEDAFRSPEGAYFKRFRASATSPMSIVPNWPTWRAIDFGYRHPACLWAQRSPAGQLFIVDELLPQNATTPEFVAKIKDARAELRPGRAGERQLLRPGRQGGQRADRRVGVRGLRPRRSAARRARPPRCATAVCASWICWPTRCSRWWSPSAARGSSGRSRRSSRTAASLRSTTPTTSFSRTRWTRYATCWSTCRSRRPTGAYRTTAGDGARIW